MSSLFATPANPQTPSLGRRVLSGIGSFFRGANEVREKINEIPVDIARGLLRSGGSVAATLTNKPVITPTDVGLSPETFRFVYGADEIKSLSTRIAEKELQGQQLGLGKAALPLSFAVVGGLTALDFTPAGGEKNALKALATANKAEDVASLLTKFKVPAKNVTELTEPLRLAKTEKEVESILKGANLVQEGRRLINPTQFKVTPQERGAIVEAAESVRPELEAAKGKPLSHAEVLKAAGDAQVLKSATTRAETVRREAELLRLKQDVAALAEGKGLREDFVRGVQTISNELTAVARQLEAAKIQAAPELFTNKEAIVKTLLDSGVEVEKMVEAAKNVDFNDLGQVEKFYREFVKPTIPEIIDEYRYINLLSSPRTHIVNAFSNMLQATVLRPATKLAHGAVDMIGSALTGKARGAYAAEVPAYARGAMGSVSEAIGEFSRAIQGKTQLFRPDIAHIPTGVKVFQPFRIIPRMLEGTDVFFRTLIKGGEREALLRRALKQGKTLDEKLLAQVEKEAAATAEEYVFRKAIDPSNATGQGHLLSGIDKLTAAVYGFRKVPGVKWFVPFVQTPMNILKQGIEYSPAGVLTLPGAARKSEQLAKTLVGSTVFMGAGMLAAQGRTTWAAPRGEKEKKAFYASGRKPYSVKIGDHWISYTKLGPLAYPIAMASAIQWFTTENPKAVTETSEKKVIDILAGIGGFFADQSYVQGMNNLLETISGDPTALKNIPTSVVGQLVPLSSLQRWVAQIIDPVYRESSSAFTLKAVLQNIQKGIPWASRGVPAETDPTGRPSRVQHPAIRALTPFDVGTTVPGFEGQLQRIRRDQRTKAIQDQKKERSGTRSRSLLK